MYRLLETIKILNGAPQNIYYHNLRMNETRKALFNAQDRLDLAPLIEVPDEHRSGTVKCRCIYGIDFMNFEFIPYERKKIGSIKLVDGGDLDYRHKYEDRSELEKLKKASGADDIIIVKEGKVTDASYANIIFRDGNRWVTPATPLLKGTARHRLLEGNKIIQFIIPVEMIKRFRSFKLINAMMDMDESPELGIELISR